MQHKVTIGLNHDLHGMTRDMYEEGETVNFKILFARDESTQPTSDDVHSIKMVNYDSCFNYYSFIMPDHDVTISLNRHNDMMMNPDYFNQAPSINNTTSFMGMSFMNENPPKEQNEEKVKRKNFCSFCGEKITKENQKFCMNCGEKL